jgi:hypothetical protein
LRSGDKFNRGVFPIGEQFRTHQNTTSVIFDLNSVAHSVSIAIRQFASTVRGIANCVSLC